MSLGLNCKLVLIAVPPPPTAATVRDPSSVGAVLVQMNGIGFLFGGRSVGLWPWATK